MLITDKINEYILTTLLEKQDLKYRDFQLKLIPNLQKENVIGVRTPDLRKFASSLVKEENVDEFLNNIPHKYFDENNIHGFIIEKQKDYNLCIKLIDEFLPFVDNWATCDMMSPAVLKKYPVETLENIKRWIKSDKVYTVRFGIEILMANYLDDKFNKDYLKLVSVIRSDEYYINMMIAWFFATALAKQFESVIPFIENRTLDIWVHNKSIQKAIESRRITDEQKEYLKSLKIK